MLKRVRELRGSGVPPCAQPCRFTTGGRWQRAIATVGRCHRRRTAPRSSSSTCRTTRCPSCTGPDRTVATIAGLSFRACASKVPVITVRQRGCGDALPELAPRNGEPVVTKTSADAFLDTDFDETLIRLGVTEVLVTGFATENCHETVRARARQHPALSADSRRARVGREAVGVGGSPHARGVREVSGGLVACSVTVVWPAAGLRCDFRNLPLKQ
ncbi:isochorismatase family protein [Streptomyces sp. NPDC002676]